MSQGAVLRQETLNEQAGGRALMLYDGLCGLCNGVVRWVNRHDHADQFRFAPQQSAAAVAILSRHGIDQQAVLENNSVYLVLDAGSDHEKLLTRSDVQVTLLLLLGGRWRILGYWLRAVPAFLRNAAYGLFARNRYRLASRYDVCPLPAEADRHKFID